MKTRHLRLVTHTHSVTVNQMSSASSPFGPVRAGLTTWQPTNDQVLEELLSSLEKEVANLLSKSSTLCDMLSIATAEVSAVVSSTVIEGAGTDDKE